MKGKQALRIKKVRSGKGSRNPRYGVAFCCQGFKTAVMKRLALLTLLIGFGLGACERHEFDGPNGTRQLHEHHGAHDTEAGHAEGGEESSH